MGKLSEARKKGDYILSARADCSDCDWVYHQSPRHERSAATKAARHHQKTHNHEVVVYVTRRMKYERNPDLPGETWPSKRYVPPRWNRGLHTTCNRFHAHTRDCYK